MEYDFSKTEIRTFPKTRIVICGIVLGIVIFFVGFLIGFFALKHAGDPGQSPTKAKPLEDYNKEYHDRFLMEVSAEKLGENLR
jgi:hypothetical protein